MAVSEVLPYAPRSVPFRMRCAVHVASAVAALLARRSPARIRRALTWLRRGSVPATAEQAAALRTAAVAASLPCAGKEGCLRRSLTVVVLARMRGRWATWCVGVRRIPPFAAHAWIEADGEPVGEDLPPDYLRRLVVVAAPGTGGTAA